MTATAAPTTTNDALGIVLDLMDLIGKTITLTRWVRDELRTDEDGCHYVPVHATVTGELHDVRAIARGSNYIRVTVGNHNVLLCGATDRLPGTPYTFTTH